MHLKQNLSPQKPFLCATPTISNSVPSTDGLEPVTLLFGGDADEQLVLDGASAVRFCGEGFNAVFRRSSSPDFSRKSKKPKLLRAGVLVHPGFMGPSSPFFPGGASLMLLLRFFLLLLLLSFLPLPGEAFREGSFFRARMTGRSAILGLGVAKIGSIGGADGKTCGVPSGCSSCQTGS